MIPKRDMGVSIAHALGNALGALSVTQDHGLMRSRHQSVTCNKLGPHELFERVHDPDLISTDGS